MHPILKLTAPALAVLAFPASAMAAGTSGTVLSVNAKQHSIEVVNSSHVVHAYRYRGKLPKLSTGIGITFNLNGTSISAVKATSSHHRGVSYYATVVRSSANGLVLALADGKHVSFSSKQINHKTTHVRHSVRADVLGRAASVTVNILGLQPGMTVMVTESYDQSGNLTITVTLPSSAPGAPPVGGEQAVTGLVGAVASDHFAVNPASGSALTLYMTPAQLANQNLVECDAVTVSYHQDGAQLIADTISVTDTPIDSNSCDTDNSGGSDEIGTITSVSPTQVTVNTTDHGTMSFIVDSTDVSDGFAVGDVVDVTYDTLYDGTLDAWDIEYVENDASGVVTAVSPGSVSFVDATTGRTDTFTADPADQDFAGVAVGDQVDVTYHMSSGPFVVDNVADNGPATPSPSSDS